MEWTGDGSKICSRVQHGGQGGVVEPAGAAHSQFNRVARQLNERWRETLGFETRAERDLMKVLHRPIEPTVISGHSAIECHHEAIHDFTSLSHGSVDRVGSHTSYRPVDARKIRSPIHPNVRYVEADIAL